MDKEIKEAEAVHFKRPKVEKTVRSKADTRLEVRTRVGIRTNSI